MRDNRMDDEKCDCCGSLGGFHMDGCPRKLSRSRILVFSNSDGTQAVGTLGAVYDSEVISMRYVRRENENNLWESCEGMLISEFFRKYSRAVALKLLSDPALSKDYVIDLLTASNMEYVNMIESLTHQSNSSVRITVNRT